MMAFSLIITALVSYLLGNHNGAICVSAMMGDDVRSHGSGNAGLTNFIRSYGRGWALLVIVIDVGKAMLACVVGHLLLSPYGYAMEGRALAGVFVMLGHDFPALQGFRGGKGILSGWFVALCVDWRVGLLIGLVFFCVYFLTRYVSLASVLAAIAFGVGFLIFDLSHPWVAAGGVLMAALAVFMHRGNIARLLRGEERKTDLFKKGPSK